MNEVKERLTKKIPFPVANLPVKYQVRMSVLLSLVPLLCGVLLMMLVFVFSKLNLFYLESNGLILDEQVRDAYYTQVQLEILGVIGYLLIQSVFTALLAYVAMRWATAPFANAYRMVEKFMNSPEEPQKQSRWLSESPAFDDMIFAFCQRLRAGDKVAPGRTVRMHYFNFRFLVKFLAMCAALSILTGYVMEIIFGVIYRHIVDLALQLIQSNQSMPHYFLAQSEILSQGAYLLSVVSFVAFTLFGLTISRYMANMIFVFSRAIQNDKFPLTLRGTDIYHDLGGILNEAYERFR